MLSEVGHSAEFFLTDFTGVREEPLMDASVPGKLQIVSKSRCEKNEHISLLVHYVDEYRLNIKAAKSD